MNLREVPWIEHCPLTGTFLALRSLNSGTLLSMPNVGNSEVIAVSPAPAGGSLTPLLDCYVP